MKIIDGKSIVAGRGFSSYREWVIRMSDIAPHYQTWTGAIQQNYPSVLAEIEHGRWIARCPAPRCNGAEYIDLDDPFFFCLSCGNSSSGEAYPVTLPEPELIKEIEKALTERPLKTGLGSTVNEKLLLSHPQVEGMHWNWMPGQSVEKLKEELYTAIALSINS